MDEPRRGNTLKYVIVPAVLVVMVVALLPGLAGLHWQW